MKHVHAIILESNDCRNLGVNVTAALSDLNKVGCYEIESITTTVAVCVSKWTVIRVFVATIIYSDDLKL